MSNLYELQPRFAALFDGLDIAFGTGRGEWVKRPLTKEDWIKHLQGHGPGIGIAPLRKDNTVAFAAIDLDEPDFDAAREMQEYIPGPSFIERSRSGNAHVWVFFSDPCPAWLAMGVLKEATLAAGKDHVEVFPKNHDFARVRLGNYINLPYHGDERPIIASSWEDHSDGWDPTGVELECEWPLEVFLTDAERTRNDPKDWHRRAALMLIAPPNEREKKANFGEAKTLHICAEHLIANMDENPVLEGHRAVVYFNLAKALTNWTELDHQEALEIMREVNAASPDTIEDRELRRILGNAERGQFTSTGCDDPLFAPYAHPDCPIAHPRSR
jgi:diadenosine tetraphosphate (Ap4A) HIT family hydrolase